MPLSQKALRTDDRNRAKATFLQAPLSLIQTPRTALRQTTDQSETLPGLHSLHADAHLLTAQGIGSRKGQALPGI